ncbi:MAG: ribosome maturation factor RimP [Elusimicrobiota bacterium]
MNLQERIESAVASLLETEKLELVDIQIMGEHGKKVVRFFIDKEGGINLSDCETMSRKMGDELDKTDIFPDGYILEVSSPGMDRVLKKEKDFVKYKGKKVRVTVFAPIDGQRNFLGEILDFENNCVKINDVTGRIVAIGLDKIARARLEPEI